MLADVSAITATASFGSSTSHVRLREPAAPARSRLYRQRRPTQCRRHSRTAGNRRRLRRKTTHVRNSCGLLPHRRNRPQPRRRQRAVHNPLRQRQRQTCPQPGHNVRDRRSGSVSAGIPFPRLSGESMRVPHLRQRQRIHPLRIARNHLPAPVLRRKTAPRDPARERQYLVPRPSVPAPNLRSGRGDRHSHCPRALRRNVQSRNTSGEAHRRILPTSIGVESSYRIDPANGLNPIATVSPRATITGPLLISATRPSPVISNTDAASNWVFFARSPASAAGPGSTGARPDAPPAP